MDTMIEAMTSFHGIIIGAPRKTNTPKILSHSTHNREQCTSTNLGTVTNQLSELAVGEGRGSAAAVVVGSDSSSESEDSECDDDVVLQRAKVEGLDLELLEVGPDGKAPLELVSQVEKSFASSKKICHVYNNITSSICKITSRPEQCPLL